MPQDKQHNLKLHFSFHCFHSPSAIIVKLLLKAFLLSWVTGIQLLQGSGFMGPTGQVNTWNMEGREMYADYIQNQTKCKAQPASALHSK